MHNNTDFLKVAKEDFLSIFFAIFIVAKRNISNLGHKWFEKRFFVK